MQLVPYSGGSVFNDIEYSSRPAPAPVITRPGWAVVLHILIHPDATDAAAAKFEQWFARRSEVSVVDVTNLEKSKLGVIVLEWLECDVDPLFIDILDHEESVADFSLHGRKLEG